MAKTVAMLEAEMVTLREENGIAYHNLQEALVELELGMEDRQWQKLSGADEQNFSRKGLDTISRESYLFYLKNPLIKRAANTQANYVFGSGITVKADNEDVDLIVQEFMNDPKNQAELTTILQMTDKDIDLQIDANIFVRFFFNTVGEVRVRCIQFSEIQDVLMNPEDAKEPWYYFRQYTDSKGKLQKEVYPDWQYRPQTKEPSVKVEGVGTVEIDWGTPVYHVKVNAPHNQKFGVSEFYAAQDWAAAYNAFLSDWATIVRSYARFAWDLTRKGSSAARVAAKTKLDSGISQGNVVPSPATGSTFIHGDDASITPIKTSGATTSADDGRRLLLMVCAATGWPETFFGDVSVGTLATAKSLDRPTELRCKQRQRLWETIWENVCGYAIQSVADAGSNPDVKGMFDDDDWGEMVFVYDTDTDTGEELDVHVTVSFPDLIEHDAKALVEAIVLAAPYLDKPYIAKALLHALSETSVEEIMERLFPDGEEPEVVAVTDAVQDLQGAIEALTEEYSADRSEVVKILVESFVEAMKEASKGDKND